MFSFTPLMSALYLGSLLCFVPAWSIDAAEAVSGVPQHIESNPSTPLVSLISALVSGIVSITVGFITYRSVRHEVQQTQIKDIIAKRIEIYPNLWEITIAYETNWTYAGKTKTREWAAQYVADLNTFNLEGGYSFRKHSI
jgi:hypothetical protein